MSKIYVVEYIYESHDKDDENERKERGVLRAFTNFAYAVAYCRKFYEGEEDKQITYLNESISVTEKKNGNNRAETSKSYKVLDKWYYEKLEVTAIDIDVPSDPFGDVVDFFVG